jgi:hypothetical protein
VLASAGGPATPVRRGDVLVLRDEDYLFASGAMTFRVLRVYERRTVRADVWVFVGGLELRADGHGRRWHNLLVRVDVLHARRRIPE